MGVFASLGSILYGYDLGVIAEAIASTNFVNLFKPTANETYLFTSLTHVSRRLPFIVELSYLFSPAEASLVPYSPARSVITSGAG